MIQVLTALSVSAIKFDAEKEQRYQQEVKQRELQRIEEALQTAARRGELPYLDHLCAVFPVYLFYVLFPPSSAADTLLQPN